MLNLKTPNPGILFGLPIYVNRSMKDQNTLDFMAIGEKLGIFNTLMCIHDHDFRYVLESFDIDSSNVDTSDIDEVSELLVDVVKEKYNEISESIGT